MKPIRHLLPLLTLTLLCSCEAFQEEAEVVCLPVNMTSTIVLGLDTKKVIADFHYLPGTDMLDHITWSNHQTHYFTYDGSGHLMVVNQLKVKEKVQDEMWFEYDGELITQVILVRRNLDYTYLEPVDSANTGRIVFEYNGMNITGETEFTLTGAEGNEMMVRTVRYEYDSQGNISSATTTCYGEDAGSEELTMSYDRTKHPFSALRYYFNGESYVNNLITRSSGIDDMDYSYEMEFNQYGYPQTVYEKLGSTHSRIIRYSYQCL
jgi:hypothetical protein